MNSVVILEAYSVCITVGKESVLSSNSGLFLAHSVDIREGKGQPYC